MMQETYKGRRLTVKARRKTFETEMFVNGQIIGSTYGTTVAVQERVLAQLRRNVDAADERRLTEPHAYADYMYGGAP